jgi:hypothetical protein
MRVHASASDLFDRQAEIATFRGVGREGLGPRLLLLFNNGRVEEFLSQHVSQEAALAAWLRLQSCSKQQSGDLRA